MNRDGTFVPTRRPPPAWVVPLVVAILGAALGWILGTISTDALIIAGFCAGLLIGRHPSFRRRVLKEPVPQQTEFELLQVPERPLLPPGGA